MAMDDDLRDKLTKGATWRRLIFMVLFGVAVYVTGVILIAVVIVQFLFKLFTGAPIERLRALGQSLGVYAYEIILYVTFFTDTRPYPFKPWPRGATQRARRPAPTPTRGPAATPPAGNSPGPGKDTPIH